MANIKSAMKRIDVTAKKTAENKAMKSKVATYVKKYKSLIAENKLEDASTFLKEVVSLIDSSNVYKANTASRKIASLSKMLSDAKKA